jgi:hypothetical protein
MNPIRCIRRFAGIVAGMAAALLAFAATAPAALATLAPPGGPAGTPPVPARAHALAGGGMPGWQIFLIAAGAALLAALVAVLLDRAHLARRKATTAAA